MNNELTAHDVHMAMLGLQCKEALLTILATTYEYVPISESVYLFGRFGDTLTEFTYAEKKAEQVHALFNGLGVKRATLDMDDFSGEDGPYEYIWLSPMEFQLFAIGNIPTNYVIE